MTRGPASKNDGVRQQQQQLGEQKDSFGSGEDMYVLAYKIDLMDLEIQLEKKRSEVWLGRCTASRRPLQEWEINLAKLNIEYQVAQGTFGVLYSKKYDSQNGAVKILDWGQEGDDQSALLRDSIQKELLSGKSLTIPITRFVGASMGTSDLKIP